MLPVGPKCISIKHILSSRCCAWATIIFTKLLFLPDQLSNLSIYYQSAILFEQDRLFIFQKHFVLTKLNEI